MGIKITTLIIGIILVGVFVTGFGFIANEMQTNYGGVPGDTNINFTSYSQLDKMANETKTLKEGVESSQSGWIGSNFVDFFKGAYDSLMMTKSTYQSVEAISEQALSQTNLGGMGQVLKQAITMIVIVLIFIGIILAVLLKTDVL